MSDLELVHYRTDRGVYVALLERGRKWAKIVIMRGKLKIRKVPMSECINMSPVDMSTTRARKSFRHATKQLGATAAAREFVYRF